MQKMAELHISGIANYYHHTELVIIMLCRTPSNVNRKQKISGKIPKMRLIEYIFVYFSSSAVSSMCVIEMNHDLWVDHRITVKPE